MSYIPLEITVRTVAGIEESLEDLRLPHVPNYTNFGSIIQDDLQLAAKLIKAGDDHAKAMRGIWVWFRLKMQVGFMIEFETYRHGVECLSTSSAMHGELKKLSGPELAEQKQADLPEKVYIRGVCMSYQALRHIYCVCDKIEMLPYFKWLIYPEIQQE